MQTRFPFLLAILFAVTITALPQDDDVIRTNTENVVLLDSSGSMEARFTLARSAAIRFLDGLREEDVAAVYRFDSKVERVQEFSGGRDLAPIAYAIHAKGITTLNDAIVEASKTLAERPEVRKAIVVLSDGMDTFSKASGNKAVESALAVGASI